MREIAQNRLYRIGYRKKLYHKRTHPKISYRKVKVSTIIPCVKELQKELELVPFSQKGTQVELVPFFQKGTGTGTKSFLKGTLQSLPIV